MRQLRDGGMKSVSELLKVDRFKLFCPDHEWIGLSGLAGTKHRQICLIAPEMNSQSDVTPGFSSKLLEIFN